MFVSEFILDRCDQDYFPKGRYGAQELYDSLRNGLVHMFTIKNKSYGLTHNRPDLHLKKDANGKIILNAGDFMNDLVKAKEKYFDDVASNPELLNKLVQRFQRDGFMHLEKIDIAEPSAKGYTQLAENLTKGTNMVSGAVWENEQLRKEEMLIVNMVKADDE